MKFADLAGHQRPLEILKRSADRERIPGAFLFHGPDGVGKRTAAMALLSYLECRDRGDGDSCGECGPCRQMDSGNFVDLHLLKPDEKGTIKIDVVRDAMPPLFFEPMTGPWKCLIIDDAHCLTIEAANAALKTLEEPPPDTMFVLVTSAPDLLPVTVLSRCLPVPFGPLKTDEVAGHLLSRGGIDREAAMEAAVRSRGSVGRALRLVDGSVLGERVDFILNFLDLAAMGPADRLAFSEGIFMNRDESAAFMDLLESVLSDSLLAVAGLPDESLSNADLAGPIRDFAGRLGPDGVTRLAGAFVDWDASRVYRPNLGFAVDRLVLSVP